MAFRLGSNTNNNVRAKATDAIVDTLDVGSTNAQGRLLIYTGSQPATPETAATGTLLVSIPFAQPAFAAADASGQAALASGTPISATVTTSGTAGWFRVVDRESRALFDGSIGTSGADLNFDNVAFIQGGVATINAMTISTPM